MSMAINPMVDEIFHYSHYFLPHGGARGEFKGS